MIQSPVCAACSARFLFIAALLVVTVVASAQDDIGECLAPGAQPSGAAEQPLYMLDGSDYYADDLPADLRQTLFELELEHYRKQLEVIDAAVLSAYLSQLAEGSGRTKSELATELFAVNRPDDQAVERFYQANQERIAYPLDAVKEQIRDMLTEQAARAKRDALLVNLKQHVAFDVGIAEPLAPFVVIATENLPSKGPQNAAITIVEFADYQCPHCAAAGGALAKIIERYPEQVRVIYMDFPVNRSGISRSVAKGAFCADQQDSFWVYHDLAFERQASLSHESPLELAETLGLDLQTFGSCLQSGAGEGRVAASEREGDRLGVNSTPTLFMNGRRLHLHDLDQELVQAIEKILATKS